MKGQLRQLLTKYGSIGILWFDGEWESPGMSSDTIPSPGKKHPRRKRVVAYVLVGLLIWAVRRAGVQRPRGPDIPPVKPGPVSPHALADQELVKAVPGHPKTVPGTRRLRRHHLTEGDCPVCP